MRPRPLSPTDVVVDMLAVARVVRLVQVDEIPAGAAREWCLDVFGESRATELLRCPHCLSVWVAAAVVFARWRWPRAWSHVARVLAGSAVAGHLAELSG